MPLSRRLRQGTQDWHRRAESTAYVQALLAGRLDAAAYALMLRNLEPLYRALEAGMQAHASHAAIAPILDPALFRASALRHDLRALQGADWPQALVLAPAAQAYAAHLEALVQSDPALLAAHAYVRYLGDLAGGQLFARLAARMTGPGGQPLAGGLQFHDFGAPAEVARRAAALRNGLDQLGVGEAESMRIVDEAVDAFRRHVDLFGELATACSIPSLSQGG